MGALDALYGPGAQAGFESACERAHAGAVPEDYLVGPRGEVYAGCSWPADNAALTIACWPNRVHFRGLTAPGLGIYFGLCEELPPFFKALGVKTFTAMARDVPSKVALLNGSNAHFNEVAPLALEWVL